MRKLQVLHLMGLLLLSAPLSAKTIHPPKRSCDASLALTGKHLETLMKKVPSEWEALWNQFLKKVHGKNPGDRLSILYNLDATDFRDTLVKVKEMIPAHQYRMQKALHALTSFDPVEACARVGLTRTEGSIQSQTYQKLRSIPEYAPLENVELDTLARQMSFSFVERDPTFPIGIKAAHLWMVKAYKIALEQLAMLASDLERTLSKENFTYFELIDLSFRYARHSSPAQDRGAQIFDTKKEYEDAFQEFEKKLAENPYLIVIPLAGDLSREDINARTTSGLPIMPVGLVHGMSKTSPDGTLYTTGEVPYDKLWGSIERFGGHDYSNHGPFLYQYRWMKRLNAFLGRFGLGIDPKDPYSERSLKQLKLALTYQSLIKKAYFTDFRGSLNSQDRTVFDYLWFDLDHEMQGTELIPTFNHRDQPPYDTDTEDKLLRNLSTSERHRLAELFSDSLAKHYLPVDQEKFQEMKENLNRNGGYEVYPNEYPILEKPTFARIKKVFMAFYEFSKRFANQNPEATDPAFQALLKELKSR